MAYNIFAEFYDLFNEAADYNALFSCINRLLKKHGVAEGIVADLGCGTGELTLLLKKSGYDMIGVDLSCEMLSVFREKMYEEEITDILLLQQDISRLDLYGTVKGAVSTFDTLNHIGPYTALEKAIGRIAMFIEPGGVFVFDVNSPYKHEQILAENTFVFNSDDARCVWKNKFEPDKCRTHISIQISENNKQIASESFYEYYYTIDELTNACKKAGLKICEIFDGESFTQIKEDTQRYLIAAQKEDK